MAVGLVFIPLSLQQSATICLFRMLQRASLWAEPINCSISVLNISWLRWRCYHNPTTSQDLRGLRAPLLFGILVIPVPDLLPTLVFLFLLTLMLFKCWFPDTGHFHHYNSFVSLQSYHQICSPLLQLSVRRDHHVYYHALLSCPHHPTLHSTLSLS